MLKEFVEKDCCLFIDKAENWQEAIRISCQPLVKNKIADEAYADELIENVNNHGPYIVLIPGVAMPHSVEGSGHVKKTAISFMKVEEPVHFDPDDPEKDAVLFFTLAAADSEEHLKNMGRLCTMLSNEDLLEDLFEVTCADDLLQLHEKYHDQLLAEEES